MVCKLAGDIKRDSARATPPETLLNWVGDWADNWADNWVGDLCGQRTYRQLGGTRKSQSRSLPNSTRESKVNFEKPRRGLRLCGNIEPRLHANDAPLTQEGRDVAIVETGALEIRRPYDTVVGVEIRINAITCCFYHSLKWDEAQREVILHG